MASNEIPRTLDKLISLAEDAADGAQTHGAAIGLLQNTEAKIRADLALLLGDPAAVPPALGSIATYDAAKTAKVLAKENENDAEKAGRDFISAAIGALRPRLGKQWNSAWNAAGFTDGSLAIPQDPLPTLFSLKNYFLANPTHEVASADLTVNITDTAAQTLSNNISTTRSAANATETALATAKDARDAGKETLYHRMTGLRAELDQLLGPDDPAWYAFGFSRPADGDSPGPISTLNLTGGGAGIVIATWSHATRAERYRVYKMLIGIDPDPVQIASDIEGLTYTFTGLPPGETLEVYIVPTNATGDGPSSPAANLIVP